jgi:hypothetical protein
MIGRINLPPPPFFFFCCRTHVHLTHAIHTERAQLMPTTIHHALANRTTTAITVTSANRDMLIILPVLALLYVFLIPFSFSSSNLSMQDPCSSFTCNSVGACATNSSGLAHCTCYAHYQGEHCEACKAGFINYPTCSPGTVCFLCFFFLSFFSSLSSFPNCT